MHTFIFWAAWSKTAERTETFVGGINHNKYLLPTLHYKTVYMSTQHVIQ